MIIVDVSNNNGGVAIKLAAKYADAMIIKLTEGTTFCDPVTTSLFDTLRDKIIGIYHYARNTASIEGMRYEAAFFCSQLSRLNLKGDEVLILDWEESPLYYSEAAIAFIDYVTECTKHEVVIYSTKGVLDSFFNSHIKNGLKTWVAYWGRNNKFNLESGSIEEEEINLFKEFKEKYNALFHQFTSKGFIDGASVDFDVNYMPDCEIKKAEKITEDMKWAIDIGIIKGYGKGIYKPDELVTRNQLVTILHRLYDKMGRDV